MKASKFVVSNFFGCKDNDIFNIFQKNRGKKAKKISICWRYQENALSLQI